MNDTTHSDRGPSSETFDAEYAKRVLLASLVIVGMGFSVLFPLLAPIGREIGLNEIQITSIIGVSSITVFLASPRWGRLSDCWGRKNIMLIGLFGFSAGTLIFNTVLLAGLEGILQGTGLFILLIGARICHAAVMSAAMPASTAYMADITTVENRTKGMGASGAANNLGSILGPSLTALAFISLLFPLWLMAALAFVNGLLVWRFLPDAPRSRDNPTKPIHKVRYSDPRIRPFVIVGVLMFTGFALVQQTMGFRFQDALSLSTTETAKVLGLAMMCSAAASLFAQSVVVQRTRLAPFQLLKLAIPLLTVAFIVMAVSESRWVLTGAMVIQGFAMGMAGPGFTAGASLSVEAEEQGAVAGVIASCGPLGFCVGPIFGGMLYQILPQLPYAVAAIMYVVLTFSMGRLSNGVR